MYNWTHYNPVKVLFGPGRLNDLHKETLPGRKALIVTSNGTSTRKYGYLARVEKELEAAGVDYVLFDQIRPNPAIPIVCITTSAGTASEVDIASVITNDKTQEKTGIFFPSMFPTLSIVDSDLMMSVPAKLTAYQGMDAFFHASETVVNKNVHPMGEMFALKTIELVAKYLPRAVADGNDREAREMMAYANTFAGYYMMCTSAHTMEHVMGSFHDDLVHGAGLIEIAHAYYGFFADRKAAEEPMIKMAKAMGVENPTSGQDFIKALDDLIASIGCADLKMSAEGITEEELSLYSAKVHEVLGGDITADSLPLSDEDYLTIFRNAYK